MKNKIGLTGIFLTVLLITFGCGSTSYLGNYNYRVTGTPDGNLTGQIAITETEDGFNCHVSSSDGYDFDLEECSITDNLFTGFYYDGMGSRIDINGTFEDNKMSGTANAGGTEFPLEFVKVEE